MKHHESAEERRAAKVMHPVRTIQELLAYRASLVAQEDGPLFLGLPERWLDNPTWLCPEGHVSRCILKSEARGDLCLACMSPVCMMPPELSVVGGKRQ